jgi:uncharacterized SAM-binding protein YcdF (DUF218 family)
MVREYIERYLKTTKQWRTKNMRRRTAELVSCFLIFVSIAITVIFGLSFSVKIIFIFNLYIISFVIALHKQISWLTKSMIITFLLILISFIVIEIAIIKEMESVGGIDNNDIQFTIVLGAGLNGDKLSNTLKQRLDEGDEYFSRNKETLIILSGGQGKDELISEAEAMHKYLITFGISQERLILESKSKTTKENLSNSKQLIDKLGIKEPTVLIITSDYHMYRAKRIAESMNIEAIGLPSKTPLLIRINYMLREYFAVVKMLID